MTLYVSMCSVYSQNSEFHVSASNCISENGRGNASLSGDVDSIIGWYGAGDIDVAQSQTASTSFTSTGPGKGCITVKFKAKGADSCSCASAASADVYKSFSLHDSIQIEGPICVSPGQTVVYSIYPIVTKNINDRIGIDSYYWNIDTMVGKPNSFVESVHYTSGDSSSVTFTVKDWDDNIGPNEISVIVGQCNINNSGAKRTLNIMKQAPKPDFGFDHLCIPYGEIPFTLTILNASSNVEYTWVKSPDWEFLDFNADSTSVTVRPNADSPDTISVSAVYKNNKEMECATTKNVLQIHRRWGDTVNVTGPQCVIAEGPQYRYSVTGEIPRRTQVRWEFPTTWVVTSKETTNQYIDAYPSSNAPLTSEIRVYELLQCESSESRYVSYFINVKPAPVNITGAQCVNANTQYLYTITRRQDAVGPDAQQYALYINGFFKRNFAADTVNVTIADTTRFIQVQPLGNNGCNGDFSDTLKVMISPTPPASITWENNHCIAAGMEDSVILSVSNAVSTQRYTWDCTTQTHNWRLKRYPTDNHSKIVLYTTGQAGLDSVKVSVESEGLCQDIPHAKIGLETDTIKFQFSIKSGAWPGSYDVECTLHDAKSYEWHYNGNPIYWYTSYGGNFGEGLVRVVVTLQDDCQLSIDTIIRGEEINHSNSRQLKRYIPTTDNKLKLTPNPANTEVKIDFPLKNSNNIVMLYSSTGQILQYIPTQEDSFILTTSSYPTGTYYVVVMQEGLHMHEKLIIKH